MSPYRSPDENTSPSPAVWNENRNGEIYWLRDFLSSDYGPGRILTYGYSSNVTGRFDFDKSNIFAHAKNLFYSLQREKPLDGGLFLWYIHLVALSLKR
jgi:hypothetical protein